jgi:hypothetical protein
MCIPFSFAKQRLGKNIIAATIEELLGAIFYAICVVSKKIVPENLVVIYYLYEVSKIHSKF